MYGKNFYILKHIGNTTYIMHNIIVYMTGLIATENVQPRSDLISQSRLSFCQIFQSEAG